MNDDTVMKLDHNTEVYCIGSYYSLYHKYKHDMLRVISDRNTKIYNNMAEEYSRHRLQEEQENEHNPIFQYEVYDGKGCICGFEYGSDFDYTITLAFIPVEILCIMTHS